VTDRLAAPAYDVLPPDQLELARLLVEPLARAASAELPYPNACPRYNEEAGQQYDRSRWSCGIRTAIAASLAR
jgi:hypothetical protein